VRLFFAFFLGGAASSSSDRAESSPSGVRFLSGVSEAYDFAPFSTVGMGSSALTSPLTSELNMSKRCMMRAVMASCGKLVHVYGIPNWGKAGCCVLSGV
jgi:hypothetical protein